MHIKRQRSREENMTKSKYHGHDIYHDGYVWRYSDTDEILINSPNVECKNCNGLPTTEGHDKGLGTLSGVRNACCGHGDSEKAYIQFLDGFIVKGEDAVTIQNLLKKHR